VTCVSVNKVTMSLAYISLLFTSLPIFFPASSVQTRHDDEPEPNLYNKFNIDSHVENANNWVGDDQVIELTCRNPSKMAEAMAIEVMLLSL